MTAAARRQHTELARRRVRALTGAALTGPALTGAALTGADPRVPPRSGAVGDPTPEEAGREDTAGDNSWDADGWEDDGWEDEGEDDGEDDGEGAGGDPGERGGWAHGGAGRGPAWTGHGADRTVRSEGGPALRFGRRQVLVVGALLAVGLLIAGWAVLRARPVALATPHVLPSSGSSSQPASQPASLRPAQPGGDAAGSASGSPAAGSDVGTGSSASARPQLEVHVLGAVRHPGLVRLDSGARVADALARAGGVTGRARLGQLNLAQPLGDGQQLFVATQGTGPPSALRNPVQPGTVTGGGGDPGSGTTGAGTPGAKVDLNTATETDLDALPGVGPVTAGKIIAWRSTHTRFSSVTELQEVDGIGPKTYANLAPRVTV